MGAIPAGGKQGMRQETPLASYPVRFRTEQPDQTRPVKTIHRTWRSVGNVLSTEETAGD